MTFQRPNIEAMQGYSPGEQLPGDAIIKLNTNENPYPPAPAVRAALTAIDASELRRYPPPLASEFREIAGKLHGLAADNVIPTNGGDELLRLILTTFVDPADTVLVAKPSYSLYPVLADIQGCKLQEVPLAKDWSLTEQFFTELAHAKLCILVNPQAPSGSLLPVETLRRVATSFSGILLIDEAYVDFIDPELGYDSIPLIRELDNVLILRTLSKGYSLAGLRFGYGLGASSLIAPMLYKTRDSYNTDLVSQRLASAALGAQDYARGTWDKVRASRKKLAQQLQELGFDSTESQSNFLLSQVPAGEDAKALYLALKQQNILVRYFDQDGLRDKLRISIGSEEENNALVVALGDLLSSQGQA